jgi:hypothetical protein
MEPADPIERMDPALPSEGLDRVATVAP